MTEIEEIKKRWSSPCIDWNPAIRDIQVLLALLEKAQEENNKKDEILHAIGKHFPMALIGVGLVDGLDNEEEDIYTEQDGEKIEENK